MFWNILPAFSLPFWSIVFLFMLESRLSFHVEELRNIPPAPTWWLHGRELRYTALDNEWLEVGLGDNSGSKWRAWKKAVKKKTKFEWWLHKLIHISRASERTQLTNNWKAGKRLIPEWVTSFPEIETLSFSMIPEFVEYFSPGIPTGRFPP